MRRWRVPEARPSIPSIRLIAFTIYTITMTVSGIPIHHAILLMNNTLWKLLNHKPPAITIMEQRICTTNFARYRTPTRSSAKPVRYNVNRAQNPKARVAVFGIISSSMYGSPQSELIPKSSEIEKQTTGVKAMPPRRGTVPLWILRASGSSNRFLLNATNNI